MGGDGAIHSIRNVSAGKPIANELGPVVDPLNRQARDLPLARDGEFVTAGVRRGIALTRIVA